MNEELRAKLIEILAGLMLSEHLGDVGRELLDLATLLDIELDGWYGEWSDADMAQVGYPRDEDD